MKSNRWVPNKTQWESSIKESLFISSILRIYFNNMLGFKNKIQLALDNFNHQHCLFHLIFIIQLRVFNEIDENINSTHKCSFNWI